MTFPAPLLKLDLTKQPDLITIINSKMYCFKQLSYDQLTLFEELSNPY